MVLSQKSVLGQLGGETRRVTLVTDPTYSTSTGSWLVNGLDADKQQHQIDLTVLPPGVFRSLIKKGQQWFIERRTTYNRLFMYVGQLDVSTVDFLHEGDLLVGTGPQTAEILPIGSSDQVLTVIEGTPAWTTISGSGGGGITEITSTGDTVIITDPTGPIVNLEVAGGGLPPWIQFGDGDPISTNPTTPYIQGALYFDTSGSSGLWGATSTTSSDWIQLGGSYYTGAGLSFETDGTGVATTYLSDLGGGGLIISSEGSQLIISDSRILIGVAGITNVSIFTSVGDPNGVITAAAVGDVCFDNGTPGVWQATAVGDSNWTRSSTGGGYDSLTGAGETATPGDLTQAGGLTVNDSGATGFNVTVAQLITMLATEGFAVTSGATAFSGTISIDSSGAIGISSSCDTEDPAIGLSAPYGNIFIGGGGSVELGLSGALILNFYNTYTTVNVWGYTGNPNGHISAAYKGDICVDSSTPGVWQATATGEYHWIQIGGILPTSSAGLVTGSLWNNGGVVNVA